MGKQVKKWGEYNTLHKSYHNLSEIDTWKAIDNRGGTIFWAIHDAGKPWAADVSMEDLLKLQYDLEYLVYSTRRFGVEFSREPSEDEHVERSETFSAWYEFWHNHFNSMDPEVYDQFVDDKCAGKDISKYLPKISWREYYESKKNSK